MELMEKHTKKNGTTGVNDLKRWPVDSNAVKFLAAIDSVSTVDELRKVRWLQPISLLSSDCLLAPAHKTMRRQ